MAGAMMRQVNAAEVPDRVLEQVSNELLENILLCDIFDVHWLVKTRKPELELDDIIVSPEIKKRKIHSSSPGPASSSRPVSCPVCKQSVGCQRFAYHLQKCMGGGSRKSSQDRRRKLNAQNSAQDSTGADQNVSQKISRLEADKEYFSKKPVIIKIRLNEKGVPIGKQPRQIASLSSFQASLK